MPKRGMTVLDELDAGYHLVPIKPPPGETRTVAKTYRSDTGGTVTVAKSKGLSKAVLRQAGLHDTSRLKWFKGD